MSEAPLRVFAELLVACDDDCRLWKECGWQSGSCSEEYGDVHEGHVDGVEVVLEVVCCGDRVTVRKPHVLDRKLGVIRSNHYSSCWVWTVHAVDFRLQWVVLDRHQSHSANEDPSMTG
jgi:hypothetical protein